MAKPKIRISTREVLKDIRAGSTDLMLMNKYGLSVRNLQRLFDRLVSAGSIEQAEIDRRVFDPGRSHVVELVPAREPEGDKAVVKAAEAVNAIRSGMNDAALMEKFSLSAKGLDSLFKKLSATGDLDDAELEQRRLSMEWGDLAFVGESLEDEQLAPDQTSGSETEPAGGRLGRFVEKHKTWLAALAGATAGMLTASILFLAVPRFERQADGKPTARSSLEATVLALQMQAKDLMKIIEGIVAETAGIRQSPVSAESSMYKQCLKRCDQSFSGSDGAIAVQRLNCKKECLAKFSERFRRVRSRYYEKK